jgi:hypothetical protein
MAVHRIRLREPWTIERLAGGYRSTRKFGLPTGLDGAEVWLTIAAGFAIRSVRVNDQLLASDSPAAESLAVEITALLRPRNQVTVESQTAIDEVTLEIRPSAGGTSAKAKNS